MNENQNYTYAMFQMQVFFMVTHGRSEPMPMIILKETALKVSLNTTTVFPSRTVNR